MANLLSAVNERRLRPIYELDNGNNKKALSEAEKVLKKQKDLTAAKVLKTIALHRLGRDKDAFVLSQEILSLEPTDENSLQGLSLYFKEIRKTEYICSLYETAVRLCPGNEEYLTHLFMSYVRHDNYQQMQKVAMNLFKQHPKNPYFFWGIMAVVLQAQYADEKKLANTMYLPLSLKMIEKHIEKGKIEAEAEVRLYVLILNLMGKHKKILEVLQGPLGDKLTSELRGKADAMLSARKDLGQWENINVQFKKLLKDNRDVWNYALGYLDSFFQLYQCNSKTNDFSNDENTEYEIKESRSCEEPDTRLSHAFQFIFELVTIENKMLENKKRGPYLIRLEMLKRLKELGNCTQGLGPPWQLILEYALDFSTKPCCFHDLVPYFSIIPEKDVDKFLSELYQQQASFTYSELNGGNMNAELTHEVNRRKEKELQRHIFTIEATRYLGKHESLFNEEKLTLASDYIQRHREGIKYSSDRPATDVRVADAYCMFAVRLLLDVYQDTEDLSLLWRCSSILEYGLSHSGYNYEMKLTLIRVYCRLGAFKPCRRLYDSLDVKHVQHETLGYTVCQHVMSLGHYDVASFLFQVSRSFYNSNDKECVECLISCFRNGTFHKVSELIDYRKAMKNSFHSHFIKVEQLLLELIAQADIDKYSSPTVLPATTPPRIDYDLLTDNRDFALITDINPENKRLTQEMIDASFIEDKSFLLFRELLFLALHSILSRCRKSTSTPQNGCLPETLNNIEYLLQELESFCDKRPQDPPPYPFHGPQVSRIHLLFEARYPQSMLLLLKYCQSLLKNRELEPGLHKDFTHYLTSAISNIKDFHKTCGNGILVEPKTDDNSFGVQSSDSILSVPVPEALLCMKPSVMERLVICIEMFSLSVLLLANLRFIMNYVKTDFNRKRRKKKSKQNTENAQCSWLAGYHHGVTSLLQLGNELSDSVKQLKLDADKITIDAAKLRLNDKDLNKKRTLSDIPEIPPLLEQSCEKSESLIKINNKEIQAESNPDALNKNCISDVARLKELSLNERDSSNSSFAVNQSKFVEIIGHVSESIQASYDELILVVEGRIDNLKQVSESSWFQASTS